MVISLACWPPASEKGERRDGGETGRRKSIIRERNIEDREGERESAARRERESVPAFLIEQSHKN